MEYKRKGKREEGISGRKKLKVRKRVGEGVLARNTKRPLNRDAPPLKAKQLRRKGSIYMSRMDIGPEFPKDKTRRKGYHGRTDANERKTRRRSSSQTGGRSKTPSATNMMRKVMSGMIQFESQKNPANVPFITKAQRNRIQPSELYTPFYSEREHLE